jgi:predicted tellurium resistance membrane protein TerC
MNKEQFFAICYVLGIIIGLATVVLMFLMTLFGKYFNENKYIEMLLLGGICLILIAPRLIIYKADQHAGFTYTNFRGYFLLFLGIVSIVLYIWLKVYIL